MYIPLFGGPSFKLRWFDILAIGLSVGASIFVSSAFTEIGGWRENVVQGLTFWSVLTTYWYERL